MIRECSECASFDTERVHIEWFTDMIEEVRICNECPAEFVNRYNLIEKQTTTFDQVLD